MLACLSLLVYLHLCRTLCIVRFVSLTPRLWKRKYENTRRNAKIGSGSMNCSIRIPKRSLLTRKSSGINTCSATFNLSSRSWWGNMYVDGVAGSTRQSLEWCTRVGLSFIIRHEYLAPIPLTRYPVTRTAKYRAGANITWPTWPNITRSSLHRTPSCKSMQAWRPCRREKKPRTVETNRWNIK